MEFFLHPWAMVFGGILVSSPIIIHLINRMRFKRIRWAAMEFLLKSQKRNRRRLIIEQLILLALRCLLVALGGFLLARFVGASPDSAEGTTHVVVLDDTPSMDDHRFEQGKADAQTAFGDGKEQIQLLAKSAAEAPSSQEMTVFLLSDLTNPVWQGRLSKQAVDELRKSLEPHRPVSIHISPVSALEAGFSYLNSVTHGQKILHFVSDFRETDWANGPTVEALNQSIDKLSEAGIHLSLIDVAHPFRASNRQVAPQHDNLAIVDLRCESHVAPEAVDVDFVVAVENFGSETKKAFLKVNVDGKEDFRATRPLEDIPAGQRHEERFTLTLSKKKPAPEIKPGDSLDERQRKRRLDQEFVHIQASLAVEPTGLQADNVRDLVVDVRHRVPTLVVDGSGPEGKQRGGDWLHLETALERNNDVDRCTVDELDSVQLELYPSLIFLNVSEIRSEKTIQKIRDYVTTGGSVAFYLGEKARPSFYNDVLFKQYAGLFPLLIKPKPYFALDPSGSLPEEDREARRAARIQRDPQPKILFRDPTHPAVATLAPSSPALRYLDIEVYHQAEARYQWEGATTAAGKAVEIVQLPNNRSIDEYKGRAQDLARLAVAQTKELAAAEPEFQKYIEPMDRFSAKVTSALTKSYLFDLVSVLDAMLKDRGPENEPQRPDMAALWAQPRMLSLAGQINEFREAVLYGDPLVVARSYGKGRVIAILTSAGTSPRGPYNVAWNDWGGGSLSSFSYPIFIKDLERWMTGQGEDLNRTVGDRFRVQLDAAKYKSEMNWRFVLQPDPDVNGKSQGTPPAEEGKQQLALTERTLSFDPGVVVRPGVFFLEFFPSAKDGAAAGQTESRAYAFNIDAELEGNLRRAARDKLERPRAGKDGRSGTVTLRAPGESYDTFKQRRPDASESPWLYVLFLVMLVCEQALAVHLSFHLRGNEAAPPAAAGRRPVRAPEAEPATV
jgi:hypothetical protein